VQNTILARSVAPGSGGNCSSPVTSLGHNLDTSDACGLRTTGDLVNADPRLAPLAYNGGFTQTQALLPGSAAFDRIPGPDCFVLTDQRGVDRPQGARCDIGAFEVAGVGPPVATSDWFLACCGGFVAELDGVLSRLIDASVRLEGAIGSQGGIGRELAIDLAVSAQTAALALDRLRRAPGAAHAAEARAELARARKVVDDAAAAIEQCCGNQVPDLLAAVTNERTSLGRLATSLERAVGDATAGELSCRLVIGLESRRFAAAAHRFDVRCNNQIVRRGSCDERRRDRRTTIAAGRLVRRIGRACAEVPLAGLGFPGVCPHDAVAAFSLADLGRCLVDAGTDGTRRTAGALYPKLAEYSGRASRCQRTLGHEGERFAERVADLRGRCLGGQLAGTTSAETLCLGMADAATADAITRAVRRLRDRLTRACKAVDLASLGFPGGGCTQGVDGAFDVSDLMRCALDVHGATIEDGAAVAHARMVESPS
jgi:hypothetical protein